MAVPSDGIEKLEDMIVRSAEATASQFFLMGVLLRG